MLDKLDVSVELGSLEVADELDDDELDVSVELVSEEMVKVGIIDEDELVKVEEMVKVALEEVTVVVK